MRKYWADLAAALLLYIATSVLAGQVFRFPFDDEVYTLQLIERRSFAWLASSYAVNNDVHPPLSYLLVRALHHLGLADSGMRLVSLLMTAASLLIFQFLALLWIERRNNQAPAHLSRMAAILLFGLAPLAISYGDALRWYPPFAMFVALFVAAYFLIRRDLVRLAAGALLGLAASTSLLAFIVAAAFAVFRYRLERRFRWQFDLGFWLLAAAFGGLGIVSTYGLIFLHPRTAMTQITAAPIVSLPIDVLGFLGGERLGIGQAWIVVPGLVITAIAIISAIDRKHPASPFHFLLLLLLTAIPLTLVGFIKPRSFLYLVPVVAAIVVFYLDQQIEQRYYRWVLVVLTLFVALSAAAIGSIRGNAHPFKRELAIPYQEAMDFIELNRKGRMLVISSDPVVTWMLRGTGDRCVEFFNAGKRCLDVSEHYDSVFIVSGHSDKSANALLMRQFAALIAGATAGREKRATMAFGLDRDAALKSRLSGVALDERLLRIEFYQ